MMYAIIEAGGFQQRVAPGDVVRVQKMHVSEEKEVILTSVLLVAKDGEISIGKPFVSNASVTAEILGIEKGDKVVIFKKKPRKGFRKLQGHRQQYTVVKIKDIVIGG
jgi:large subunit ribosomal protein L21